MFHSLLRRVFKHKPMEEVNEMYFFTDQELNQLNQSVVAVKHISTLSLIPLTSCELISLVPTTVFFH